MKDKNQNLGMKDEISHHRERSASQKFNSSKAENSRPDQENMDEYQNGNYDFDERDQKQNVGQNGDTYPPDDKRPEEEDLSGEDDLRIVNRRHQRRSK